MPDQNIVEMITAITTSQATTDAKMEALHETVREVKAQMKAVVDGISETQKDIVVALERLNTNLEDHKIIHQRITDMKESQEDLRGELENVKHTCAKETSEETAEEVKQIQKVLQLHGITDLRDGQKGHGDLIASHERMSSFLSGKYGRIILAAVVVGSIIDYIYHREAIKNITSIFPGM